MDARAHDEIVRYLDEQEASAVGGRPATILTWDDIPWADQLPAGDVSWLVEEMIPARGITLVAGESGCYKTWLALCLARGVAMGSTFLGRACCPTDVLYLDRENPPALVRARLVRLGLMSPHKQPSVILRADASPRRTSPSGSHLDAASPLRFFGPESGPQNDSEKNAPVVGHEGSLAACLAAEFRLWGGWQDEPPPGIGDARLVEIARQRQPLLIFDSLIRFHQQDENSATAMALVMNDLRALANAGATVVVLHHKPKGDGSHYRGSSDIRAAVDLAWAVSKQSDAGATAGLLKMACFKNRYAVERTLTLRADLDVAPGPAEDAVLKGGATHFADFAVLESPSASERDANVARLRELIAAHPGLSQSELVEQSGLAQKQAIQLLRRHDMSLWRKQKGPGHSLRFYPADTDGPVGDVN